MLIIPFVLIVLSLPLIAGMVPRNGLYGFRTPSTMRSDEIWYPANRFSGITFVIAAIVQAVVLLLLASVTTSAADLKAWRIFLMLGTLGLALAASLVYLRRISGRWF